MFVIACHNSTKCTLGFLIGLVGSLKFEPFFGIYVVTAGTPDVMKW